MCWLGRRLTYLIKYLWEDFLSIKTLFHSALGLWYQAFSSQQFPMGKVVSSAQPYCFSPCRKGYTEQETSTLLDQYVWVELPVPKVLHIIRDKLLVELLLNILHLLLTILHRGLQPRGWSSLELLQLQSLSSETMLLLEKGENGEIKVQKEVTVPHMTSAGLP